jgi:hypothetical protein
MTKKIVLAVVGCALLIAGCGSSSGDTDESNVTTTEARNGVSAESTTTLAGSTDDTTPSDETSGDTTGSITFDGVTYEFGMNGPVPRCEIATDGSFNAILYMPNLTESLIVKLYHDENRINYVRAEIVDDGVMTFMNADPTYSTPAIEPGTSFVDNFAYDDMHAEGTGSFVNVDSALGEADYPLAPVVGTFEVNCP